MSSRQTKIIAIVNREGKLEVNELARLLAVSAVTIRKDLDELEKKGLLRRKHGFAVKCSEDDVNNRLAFRHEIKRQLAITAADLVRNGETVMIESGSSCALLAAELSKRDIDVTMITNSAFIAGYVRENGNAKVILLGGEYQMESQVMVGPLVRVCAQQFYVDKLFVGTDGFDPEYGFTGSDMMRTEAVKAMAESARKVYLLADADKFSAMGIVKLLPFEAVTGVVTNEGVSEKTKKIVAAHGIEVWIGSQMVY
jgi:DeoR/GlpR family transcriptional regulator of sugar metabolism